MVRNSPLVLLLNTISYWSIDVFNRAEVQWKNHIYFLAAQELHPVDVWILPTKFQVIWVRGNWHRHPPFPKLLFKADFPFFHFF